MTERDQCNNAQRYGTVMVNRPALQAWLLSWTNASFSTALPQFVTTGQTAVKTSQQPQFQKTRRSREDNP